MIFRCIEIVYGQNCIRSQTAMRNWPFLSAAGMLSSTEPICFAYSRLALRLLRCQSRPSHNMTYMILSCKHIKSCQELVAFLAVLIGPIRSYKSNNGLLRGQRDSRIRRILVTVRTSKLHLRVKIF
ncbi:unnamed protein product [Nesidiocoris tenuis]|uniref:Uncharacterized protein n=1 Tax=Nesidiocoris tenuis TaxID=355587 RepID=A0A6H5HG14_9HEMI|nr:unnamed protein product [Nesidiocoris tenuis]